MVWFIIPSGYKRKIRQASVLMLLVIAAFMANQQHNQYLDRKNSLAYLETEIDSFEVVIARYNEDLSWLEQEFPREKVTIYNKGLDDLAVPDHYRVIKLPNVGRDLHTIFYHIVTNYNHLPDRILFLQGNPYDAAPYLPLKQYKKIAHTRCQNIIAANCWQYRLGSLSDELQAVKWESTKWSDTKIAKDKTLLEFARNMLNARYDQETILYVSYQAMFAVDKEKILTHPVEFYQELLNRLAYTKSPIEGHYLERLIDLVF